MRHSFLTFCINNLRKDKDINECKERGNGKEVFSIYTNLRSCPQVGPLKIDGI